MWLFGQVEYGRAGRSSVLGSNAGLIEIFAVCLTERELTAKNQFENVEQ